jgi:DnaJ-domain-containing protein 1
MTARVTAGIRVPATTRCPECGANRISPLVCPRCRATQPVTEDVFELFGLQRSWAVDPQELEERYAAISSLLDSASEAAAALDAARRVLMDPLARGRYLIGLYGGEPQQKPAESSSEFLTDVMQLRREAEEAITQRDAGRLAAVIEEGEEKLGSLIIAAGQSFTRLERALADEVAEAAQALAGASYWSSVVDELRSRKARMEGTRPSRRDGEETVEL